METILLNGRLTSQKIQESISAKILNLSVKPGLAVIEVGNDPASDIYIRKKEEACKKIGMNWKKINLPADCSQEMLFSEIDKLNKDPSVHGILVQFPLPGPLQHLEEKVIYAMEFPKKDVDGFHPYNVGQFISCHGNACTHLLMPCTPYGIIRLLTEYSIPIAGKHAVVVGRSNLTGKPVSLLLLSQDATVTMCHSKTENLSSYTKQGDIVIVAVGKMNFIDDTFIKDGAVVVDVGIHSTDHGVIGDVNFDAVKNKVKAITPVPGGVGPMTIAILMENVLKAYWMQQ